MSRGLHLDAYLLAYDTGAQSLQDRTRAGFLVRAAALAELAHRGAVEEDGAGRVRIVSAAATGDPVLDALLSEVGESRVRPAVTAAKSWRRPRARLEREGKPVATARAIQPARSWPRRLVIISAKVRTQSATASSSGQRARSTSSGRALRVHAGTGRGSA
ncbi:GPP34 family phosphoprotein [Kitasatospora sp. NPDC101183]|uniref:GPP34 family phosphoprotein n=1 Tax=Kitasatospora sp. NPDC101183 TaxID=3364100 RepID=UPI0038181E77